MTHQRPSCLGFLLSVFLSGLLARPAAAQRQGCITGPISAIFIDNHDIFDMSDPELDRRFVWAYRAANSLHVRTRQRVIRRELLFGVGDCYEPLLLSESERLLRAYDFLSRVEIFAVPQQDGSYHVVVDTQDEWSTQVDVRIGTDEGLAFQGARLREANLLGTGRSVTVFYREDDVEREYGGAFETPQLMGTRWDLRLAAGRTRAGTSLSGSLAYPFVGEVGRWAARQGLAREDRFFEYFLGDGGGTSGRVLVPVREKALDLSLIRRLGRPGNLLLFGGAVTFQSLRYPGGEAGIEVDRTGDAPPSASDSLLADSVGQQMAELNNIRLFFLLGQRNIWWTKRRGLDALRGQQDVRLGAEAELAFGRSVRELERANDLFTGVSLYSGTETAGGVVVGRLRADARRDFDAPAGASEWQDVFADGELLAYRPLARVPRHTLVFRAVAAGGWNTRTPFQLTLGGDHALRGYDDERYPGGRRAVLSLEDRVYFGWPFPDVFDLGGTLFLDVGRTWPGDVPFGVDSGWRSALGAGLRGSFPAGGRTTYKIDLALPLESGLSLSDLRISFRAGEVRGLIAAGVDPQIMRSRRQALSGELFHFPN